MATARRMDSSRAAKAAQSAVRSSPVSVLPECMGFSSAANTCWCVTRRRSARARLAAAQATIRARNGRTGRERSKFFHPRTKRRKASWTASSASTGSRRVSSATRWAKSKYWQKTAPASSLIARSTGIPPQPPPAPEESGEIITGREAPANRRRELAVEKRPPGHSPGGPARSQGRIASPVVRAVALYCRASRPYLIFTTRAISLVSATERSWM
jgi:hypothetical protein